MARRHERTGDVLQRAGFVGSDRPTPGRAVLAPAGGAITSFDGGTGNVKATFSVPAGDPG